MAVAEVVKRQVATGVDVVSDGEQGKPGFANYVRDRLTGLDYREGVPPKISAYLSNLGLTVSAPTYRSLNACL